MPAASPARAELSSDRGGDAATHAQRQRHHLTSQNERRQDHGGEAQRHRDHIRRPVDHSATCGERPKEECSALKQREQHDPGVSTRVLGKEDVVIGSSQERCREQGARDSGARREPAGRSPGRSRCPSRPPVDVSRPPSRRTWSASAGPGPSSGDAGWRSHTSSTAEQVLTYDCPRP